MHFAPSQINNVLMSPNEALGGNIDDRAELSRVLLDYRQSPSLAADDHPELEFVTLADALALQQVDERLFNMALTVAVPRYSTLGLDRMLPLDRVRLGVAVEKEVGYGGFHYPDQGYRFMQMIAVFTRYGDLTGSQPVNTGVAALDLIRSYAHDCLHWGSYRRFRLMRDDNGVHLRRVRYGINFRSIDGRPYSRLDTTDGGATRNIGVLMEGATDREAQAIVRKVAEAAGIRAPKAGTLDRLVYDEVTGALDTSAVTVPEVPGTDPAGPQAYERRLKHYAKHINDPYKIFLSEFGDGRASELHTVICTCMINGSLAPLVQWLDRRHGPGAFRSIVKGDDQNTTG